jgi:hypothetical protein
VLLSPGELGQRAQILPKRSIPLEGVVKDEIAEINGRKRQEEEAVEEMEKKRAGEKEIGRGEIIESEMVKKSAYGKELGREEIIYGRMEQPNKETIHESGNLPVCTRTPRMLITGESVIYQNLALCANDSKYLHQQRFGMI